MARVGGVMAAQGERPLTQTNMETNTYPADDTVETSVTLPDGTKIVLDIRTSQVEAVFQTVRIDHCGHTICFDIAILSPTTSSEEWFAYVTLDGCGSHRQRGPFMLEGLTFGPPTPTDADEVAVAIVQRLVREHPEWFRRARRSRA